MSAESDLFDDLLGLEDEFYQQGYEAGLADGEHAGIVEGKLFGIEKGYEKAVELGKLHGRAMIWQIRQSEGDGAEYPFLVEQLQTAKLPVNSRLTKNITTLLKLSDGQSVKHDNSDESVADFDDRIFKAQAKAKVIAAVIGEPIQLDTQSKEDSGIEESNGLNARK